MSKAAAEDLDFYTQSVRFRVDGKAFVGCMDIDALGELQKIWGLTSLADMQARVENVGFAEMKDIVFVSLLRDQPQLTRPQADKISNAMGMNGIVKYVSDVMRAGSAPPSAVQPGPTRRATARKSR
jgi:hypothetical protein